MGDRPIASLLPVHMATARITFRGERVHRLTFNPVKNILQVALGVVALKQIWRHKLLVLIFSLLPLF